MATASSRNNIAGQPHGQNAPRPQDRGRHREPLGEALHPRQVSGVGGSRGGQGRQDNRGNDAAQRRCQIEQDHELAVRLAAEQLGEYSASAQPYNNGHSEPAAGPGRTSGRRAAGNTPARDAAPAREQVRHPEPPQAADSAPARGAAPARDPVPARAPTAGHVRIQRTAPAQEAANFDCQICVDPTTPDASLATNCGHDVCRTCLQTIFENALRDRSTFPPRCCPLDQRGEITLDMARHLLCRELASTFEKKAIEYRTANPTFCHRPSCAELIPPENTEADRIKGTCPKCRRRTCTMCKQADHRGRQCPADENQQLFEELASRRGWQHCPKCNTAVEKVVGCNHMTCICRHEFCYECRRRHGTCECDAIELHEMFPLGDPFWMMPLHQQRALYEEATREEVQHPENRHERRVRFEEGDDDDDGEPVRNVFRGGNVFGGENFFFDNLHRQQEAQRQAAGLEGFNVWRGPNNIHFGPGSGHGQPFDERLGFYVPRFGLGRRAPFPELDPDLFFRGRGFPFGWPRGYNNIFMM